MPRLTVIDLFCGAGGFSEGFRQQGFEILAGYDHWGPAVDTFSHNFGAGKGIRLNILDLEKDDALIDALPNTDIILGSPPCVSFSSSNRSGNADKSLGLRLTKTFLRIVAIKKHQPDSQLRAWFIENVVRSMDHVAKDYSFHSLGLTVWAERHGIDPRSVAVTLKDNHVVMNAADHGAPQHRFRAVAGEIIPAGGFIMPKATHYDRKGANGYIQLGAIKKALTAPNSLKQNGTITDPLYPSIKLGVKELTDHFYDTGLYQIEWSHSQFQKTNHPYMGRMSFPENPGRPSRTITATKIGTSREAIIYTCERGRLGDGQYRTPTIRESATLMSFPITYQFIGKETAKCKLVGNAVCPSVSRAIARTVRRYLGLPRISRPVLRSKVYLNGVIDLNTFAEKQFDRPPIKKKGARFRSHLFKDGNITVTLSNYQIRTSRKKEDQTKKSQSKKPKGPAKAGRQWITSVQYGNGDGFPSKRYPDGYYKGLEKVIKSFEKGEDFIKVINNGFSEKIAAKKLLQQIHEEQKGRDGYHTPSELITCVLSMIDSIEFREPDFAQTKEKIFLKPVVPKKQILALYAINKICTVTNA